MSKPPSHQNMVPDLIPAHDLEREHNSAKHTKAESAFSSAMPNQQEKEGGEEKEKGKEKGWEFWQLLCASRAISEGGDELRKVMGEEGGGGKGGEKGGGEGEGERERKGEEGGEGEGDKIDKKEEAGKKAVEAADKEKKRQKGAEDTVTPIFAWLFRDP